MNDELQRVRNRLRQENMKRGALAVVASGSGVSSRTIYNVMHSPGDPHIATVDKLAAYFKKVDKKLAKEAV